MRRLRVLFVLLMFSLIAGCSSDRCPSEEKLKKYLEGSMAVKADISSISPLKEINGICEIVILLENRPFVFYSDSTGNHIISGSIVETATKKNITAESINKHSQPVKK